MFDNTYYCDENPTSARSAVPATTATAASALRHHEGPGRWSQGAAPGNARAAAHPTSPGLVLQRMHAESSPIPAGASTACSDAEAQRRIKGPIHRRSDALRAPTRRGYLFFGRW